MHSKEVAATRCTFSQGDGLPSNVPISLAVPPPLLQISTSQFLPRSCKQLLETLNIPIYICPLSTALTLPYLEKSFFLHSSQPLSFTTITHASTQAKPIPTPHYTIYLSFLCKDRVLILILLLYRNLDPSSTSITIQMSFAFSFPFATYFDGYLSRDRKKNGRGKREKRERWLEYGFVFVQERSRERN